MMTAAARRFESHSLYLAALRIAQEGQRFQAIGVEINAMSLKRYLHCQPFRQPGAYPG